MNSMPAGDVYTVDFARRVLGVIDAGLVSGLGQPVPGEMCVEAAICYALGLPHGDDPGCVSPAVRSFKIALNDKAWSSPHARARGLRALGIAQIGSKGVINDTRFLRLLSERLIQGILPIALRAAAKQCAAAYPSAAADVAADAAACAAAACAAAACGDAAAAYDGVLVKVAGIAFDILRELRSPGVALWDELVLVADRTT